MDLERIREAIPALSNCTYLNCGTFGPTPTSVADEVVRLVRLTEGQGPYSPEVYETMLGRYEDARKAIASLLGAAQEEIALTRNATDGANIVATGFDWQPGDEVVISDEEHPSGALPWMNLAKRRGIVVKLLALQHDTDGLLERLDGLIGPRTRLVFLSHVSSVTGFRLPVARICELVRSKGVPIMLDGAHAVGQLPVDPKALGCDFYTGSGHKWLLGPQGTGFLYVARERLDEPQVTWLGWGMTESYDLPGLTFEAYSDARKFEYGTKNWGLYGGLAESIRFAGRTGMAEVQARNLNLADRMKRLLADIPGLEITTPMDPELSTGIVSLRTAGLNHPNPGRWLWDEHRILVSHNAAQQRMRLSLPYFILEDEVDMVAERLASLARQ